MWRADVTDARSLTHIVRGMGVESLANHAVREQSRYNSLRSPVICNLHFTYLLQINSISSLAEPMAHRFFMLGTAPGRLHISGQELRTHLCPGAQYNTYTGT